MPFKSTRQMRFMFAKHPDIANKWVKEAKKKGESPVQKSWIPGKGWVKASEAGKGALVMASRTKNHQNMRRVTDEDAAISSKLHRVSRQLKAQGVKPGVQDRNLGFNINGMTWRTGSKSHGKSYVAISPHLKGEHRQTVINHELAHAAPKRSSYRFHKLVDDPEKLGREEARAVWRSGERTPLNKPPVTASEKDNGYRLAHQMTNHNVKAFRGNPGTPGTTGTHEYGRMFNKLQEKNPNPKPPKMPKPQPEPAKPAPQSKKPLRISGGMAAGVGAGTGAAAGGAVAYRHHQKVNKSLYPDMWEGISTSSVTVSKSTPDVSAMYVPGTQGSRARLRKVKHPKNKTCM